MKKSNKITRFSLLLAVLLLSILAQAQTPNQTKIENFDIESAKGTINRILNDKDISVSDKFGKIKYEEAKVFDDRIELITKKGNKVFYFRDMLYPGEQNKVELSVTCITEHVGKGESFLKEHDNFDCRIINNGYPTFRNSHKIFNEDGSYWGNPNLLSSLAKALSTFQHKITYDYKDSINNNAVQKLKNDLLEFQGTAKTYQQLAEKPTITEEQRKYIVQANAFAKDKAYASAIGAYQKVIAANPVAYPATYYNMALLYAETKDYKQAIFNMKKYLLLVPDAPDARAAQDKIYEWER